MVKGTTRQVVVVRTTDTDLFEQAIFLLKEDSLEKQGITERQILEEARRISQDCLEKPKGRKLTFRPLAWSTVGAGLTALAWLLTAILS